MLRRHVSPTESEKMAAYSIIVREALEMDAFSASTHLNLAHPVHELGQGHVGMDWIGIDKGWGRAPSLWRTPCPSWTVRFRTLRSGINRSDDIRSDQDPYSAPAPV